MPRSLRKNVDHLQVELRILRRELVAAQAKVEQLIAMIKAREAEQARRKSLPRSPQDE